MFFEAGVKNQNFKLDPIAWKFCMGLYGNWETQPKQKIVTAQKSSKMCFYIILGGQSFF